MILDAEPVDVCDIASDRPRGDREVGVFSKQVQLDRRTRSDLGSTLEQYAGIGNIHYFERIPPRQTNRPQRGNLVAPSTARTTAVLVGIEPQSQVRSTGDGHRGR